MQILYAMPETSVRDYAASKDLLIETRAAMKKNEVKAAKEDVIKNAKVYDFNPEEPPKNEELYMFDNGLAKINIAGMLVQEASICASFYGETVTTYRYIREAILRADADPFVERIVLYIDSNGGNLDGLEITSQRFFSCNKKTTAVVLNKADSAAYWLASSCDEIILASKTSEVGSVGVVIEFYDRSEAEAEAGVKRQFITNTSSSEKIADLRTDEGKKLVVDRMNTVYNIFKETILRKRSASLTGEKIDSLKGRVLIGAEALEYGLADKMMDVDEIGDYFANSSVYVESAPLLNADGNIKKENFMSDKVKLNEVLAKYPDAKAEYETEKTAEKARTETALTTDRKRVARILTLSGTVVSESVLADVESGLTIAEFSEKELESKNRINASANKQDLGGLSSADQLPKELTADEIKESALLSRVDGVIDKLVGKNDQKGAK